MSNIVVPAGLLGAEQKPVTIAKWASNPAPHQYVVPAGMIGAKQDAFIVGMVTADYSMGLSDNIALADGFSAAQLVEWADSFSLASAFTYVSDLDDGLSDAFAMTDQFSVTLHLSIADAFALSDTITMARLATAFADAIGLDDSFSARIEAALSMTDQLGITDSLFHALGLGISDAFSIADAFISKIRAILSLSDSFAMTDAFSGTATFVFFMSDSIALADDGFVPRLEAALAWGDSLSIIGTFALSDEEKYLAWVVNTKTLAPYKFQSYPFNSFAKAGNKILACAEDGIYTLGGDTDDGSVIGAYLKTGLMDFGTEHEKRIDEAFLAYSADGETLFKIIFSDNGSKTEQWYKLRRRPAEVERSSELDIHRGIESTRFQFELHALDGKPARFEKLTLLPVVTSRMT